MRTKSYMKMKMSLTFLRYSWLTIILIISLAANLLGQDQDLTKILWTANWSSDGKYIAVGGVDKKIRIFSGESYNLVKVFENSTEIHRMSWHPYSNLLAIAAVGDGSKLIDIEKDSIISFKGDKGFGSRAIAWNYTGDLPANADYEGEITIWTKYGQLIRTIKKENTISNVAIDWHPHKNEFIVLSEAVRIYDAEGNLLNKFVHRKEQVLMLCVKWHKTGDYFVLGDYGDHDYNYTPLLQYWKANGTLTKELRASKAEYRNMSWTKDGKKLATASDALRIWDTDGNLISEVSSEEKLWGVDWSPDGSLIITSSHGGSIKLWDNKGNVIKKLDT